MVTKQLLSLYIKLPLCSIGFAFLIFLTSIATSYAQGNGTGMLNNDTRTIPVSFALREAGYVTLVVENEEGVRVRNLVSDTWFKAGKNTVWWDGLDDLGRDTEAAKHGIYNIPAAFVKPGSYKVRGLVHSEITTSYEFPVYTTGTPPWFTSDHMGAWLSTHSAPQAALFVPAKQSPTGEPAVYLGTYITEGSDGMAWVNLDGKKLGGKKFIGGIWTAAPYMARDNGTSANMNIYAYAASVWETGKKTGLAELRITGLTKSKDIDAMRHPLGAINPQIDVKEQIGGIAVRNEIAIVSLTAANQVIVIDLKSKKVVNTIGLTLPRGVTFDTEGRLLILSGNNLVRFNKINSAKSGKEAVSLISKGLTSPVGIAQDDSQNIYISDAGTSHQVKVFNSEGKFLRSIGRAGAPQAGPYDPLHMNNPAGITVDSRKQLWVAENDFLPKRVSVWSLDGKFIKAFYGPAKYGGGGSLDANDKNKYYYADGDSGVMEFELNWTDGSYALKNVLYRKTPQSEELAFRSAAPETAIYYKGKRFFTNCFNTNPTHGHSTAFIFTERNGQLYPAAGMGNAKLWDVLKQQKFKSLLPAGTSLEANSKSDTFFIWYDINADAHVQPDEVQFKTAKADGVTVMNDLSFCLSLGGDAVQFKITGFTNSDVPMYSLTNSIMLAKDIQGPASSGGNQILTSADGWTVATLGIKPFHRYSVSGAKNGKPLWSYPNLWPGLHASHSAPLPEFSGELIAPTRLLGSIFNEKKGADALWAVNSNHGMIYVFTVDGFFVTTLFEPMRTGKRWNMPNPTRGMSLDSLTLSEENFWPSITQTPNGEVYMVDGTRSSLVHIKGLQSIQRILDVPLSVTLADINKCRAVLKNKELERQEKSGNGILAVAILKTPPVIDGVISDWQNAAWADIEKSGIKGNFNSSAKPFNVTGAVAVTASRLYVAYKTGDANLLKNSGESDMAPFKTGGALDIMIGAAGSKNRDLPQPGDVRLLVTNIKGKPYALLYRAVVNGKKPADKIPFSSPSRTITFDKVENVTSQLEFAANKDGDYEISLPLSLLGIKPKQGLVIKGDIGVLRGDGYQTIARSYWHNKATAIVSDVPSEAELSPAFWGAWQFK